MHATLLAAVVLAAAPRIHCVSDISHEFTFYMDGRFFNQYVGEAGGADVRNWGTLWKLDLANANLLALSSGSGPVAYDPRTVAHVRKFAEGGGAALIMADRSGLPAATKLPIADVAAAFGAGFAAEKAEPPLRAEAKLGAEKVEFYGGGTLELKPGWEPLVTDARGKPVLARRGVGKGCVLVGIRGLFGNRPDASDPINSQWVRPLLQDAVKGKAVDAGKPFQGQSAELTKKLGALTVEYHEGTKQFADAIAKEYFIVREHLVKITGVPPSPGTLTNLLMLPTGGGGFSSGDRIGIGAWWGDFPKNRYPMIELIGHEAAHSWVLPYAEPVWNEPIATYLGIQVGKAMGMPEAQKTLEGAVERARRDDPEMRKVDIGAPGAPNAAVWGKTFWIFEQIRAKHGDDAMAKYFQAKRRLLKPGRKGYSLDDCVAVWSAAVGEDLFPWFRSLGISVDRTKADVGG